MQLAPNPVEQALMTADAMSYDRQLHRDRRLDAHRSFRVAALFRARRSQSVSRHASWTFTPSQTMSYTSIVIVYTANDRMAGREFETAHRAPDEAATDNPQREGPEIEGLG